MGCSNIIYIGQNKDVLEELNLLEGINLQTLSGFNSVTPIGGLDTAVLIDEALFFDDSERPKLKDFKRDNPFLPLVLVAGLESQRISIALAEGAADFVVPGDTRILQRLTSRCDEIQSRQSGQRVKIGDLEINTFSSTISGGKGSKSLSPTEMNLLKTLATAKGHIVDRSIIKRECWGKEDRVSDNALNRKLHEVRRAVSLVSEEVCIKTVYGHGFKLDWSAIS